MVDERIINYVKEVEGLHEEREGCYDHYYY